MEIREVHLRRLKRIIRSTILGTVIGLSINGCTQQHIRVSFHHDKSDQELVSFVENINSLSNGKMKMNTDKNRIGFKKDMRFFFDESKVIAGTCNYVLPFSFEIDINKSTWDRAGYMSRLLLVAHEMYHCVCKNIGHDDREDLIGCPESYNHPSMPPTICVNMNSEKYLKQVEKGCEL